jgi:hypothetical protein
MMGIPCEGPAYIYGANQSVLASCGIPDSILKKGSQSIAYHSVREGDARDEWRTSCVNTHDNEADLLTKLLPSGEKRKGFCCKTTLGGLGIEPPNRQALSETKLLHHIS